MNKLTPIKFLLLLSATIFWSCESNDEAPTENTPATLKNVTRIFQRPVGDLAAFIELSGLDIDQSKMKYNVTLYKVTYLTNYKGSDIEASAIVLLPDTNEPVGTVSFQHGTIGSDNEAPTNLILGDGQIILTSALSSMGYVVVFPDFIGFGSSAEIMHPYYIEELTATSVMDAIYAARETAEAEGIRLKSDLYLAGYSQGGYATMATHKYYEEHDISFFDLRASFPSSGGYDIKAFQDYFFGLDTYHQPFFMAYVAQAYKVTYDWSEPLSTFFNEPYASRIPDLFDGSKTGGQINVALNDTIEVFVNNTFLNNPDAEEFKFISDAFEANSLTDWTPSIRMLMYHGDADITVPYDNSVSVYNQLLANGASTSVVTFTTLEGGTHGTGVSPYIEKFVSELINMNH